MRSSTTCHAPHCRALATRAGLPRSLPRGARTRRPARPRPSLPLARCQHTLAVRTPQSLKRGPNHGMSAATAVQARQEPGCCPALRCWQGRSAVHVLRSQAWIGRRLHKPLVCAACHMARSLSTAAAACTARSQADLELATACELAAPPPACLGAAPPGAAEPAAGAAALGGAAGPAGCGPDPAGPGPAAALRARAAAALEGLTAHALLGLAEAGGTLQAPLPRRIAAGLSYSRKRPSASCALCDVCCIGAH